jgi:uncharacterized protein
MIETNILIVGIIIFVAALCRSTFGFGDALIAMPLLALVMDIQLATPIVAVSGFLISMAILLKNRQKIMFREIRWLILFSVLGIPIGILYLKYSDPALIKIFLGIVLVVFSIFKLMRPSGALLKTNKSAFIYGFVSGVLGGAYNTNGPPIIIFGTLKGWAPDEFRLLLQGVFLPTNLFIIIGHSTAGLWNYDLFMTMLMLVPVIALAIVLGNYFNKRIPGEKFHKFIFMFLIVIGVVLIGKSI